MAGELDLNGKALSYASIKNDVDGDEVLGITAIRYKAIAAREFAFGNGRMPQGVTAGQVVYEGSLTWRREALKAYRDKKSSQSGGRHFLDSSSNFTVNYEEDDTLHTTELLGMFFTEYGQETDNESSGALTQETPMLFLMLKEDGVEPFERR
ncbi:MAG: hypothetical protein ACPGWS_07370 [Solirubrobacterales bacterium]